MRLPRMASPIKSGTFPFLSTAEFSLHKPSVPEKIVTNRFLGHAKAANNSNSRATNTNTSTIIIGPTTTTPMSPTIPSTCNNPTSSSSLPRPMSAIPVDPDTVDRGRHDRSGEHGTAADGESVGVGGVGHSKAKSRASSGPHETTLDKPEQTPIEGAHYTVPHKTSRTTVSSRMEEPHGEMKPPGFGVVGFTNPEPQAASAVDPLDLVIAKRKKKELADPVIAEAILTASKLPPPPIPETQNLHDVPEEIQQLLSFGFARPTMTEKDLEFLRNYPLHQKLKEPLTMPAVSQSSRYEMFRRKYWTQAFHRRQVTDEEGAEEGHEREPKGYTNGGSMGYTQITGSARKDFFPISIHTDEDWFMESVLHVMCILLIVFTLPLSLIFCLKVVAHYERAVLFRLGRLVSATAQGPGLIIVLPCLDRYRILDLRTFTFDVPTQEVLTKDSVTVVVNAVVYYRVRDPVRAVVNVEDANRATRVLGQTTLRNVLGTVNLDQLLTAREDIAALMQECLDSVTEAWGVKVERVEIKDVRLPIQLQRAMAAEAESVREATAKVIAAEGEMRASGALKAAAFEIKQHPIAMQLRYLQAMSSISCGKESTIIFPVPLDLLSFFHVTMNSDPNKVHQLLDEQAKQLMSEINVSIESLQAAASMSASGMNSSEKRLIEFDSAEDSLDQNAHIV